MSARDIIRSFAESRETNVRSLKEGYLNYGIIREVYADYQRLETENAALRAELSDPAKLHAHVLRTLSREQIDHLLGDETQRLRAELEAANKRADGARAEVRDMQESVETYRSRYNAENVRAIQAEGERDREAKAAREARAMLEKVRKSIGYIYDSYEQQEVGDALQYVSVASPELIAMLSLARSESKGGE